MNHLWSIGLTGSDSLPVASKANSGIEVDHQSLHLFIKRLLPLLCAVGPF